MFCWLFVSQQHPNWQSTFRLKFSGEFDRNTVEVVMKLCNLICFNDWVNIIYISIPYKWWLTKCFKFLHFAQLLPYPYKQKLARANTQLDRQSNVCWYIVWLYIKNVASMQGMHISKAFIKSAKIRQTESIFVQKCKNK